MKTSLRGFRALAFGGSLIDLAIGIAIGAAFAGVVASVVKNLILPLVADLFVSPDLTTLHGSIRGNARIEYGTFLTDFIAFQRQRLQYAEGLEAAYGEVLVGLLREIKAALDNREALDEAVRVRVEKHFVWDLLSPAPGAGPSVISRVAAEMGDDPTRFEDKGGLAAFAGVAPKMHQSGEFTGLPGRRQVKGNRLHQAFWDWASSAVMWSPGAMEYYWAHRA